MITQTLLETRLPDSGQTVRLIYRCRMCNKIFVNPGNPEDERDFSEGKFREKVLHDVCFRGTTGIADLIGWEKA